MKRLQLWGLVGVAVLAGLGYGSWQWWAGPRIAVEVLQRQDVVQTMVASGHVQSPHRTDVSAQVTGRVVAIPVAEGQWVRQGQTLIELDSSEAQANHQQALANSQQAQVNVRQLLELRLSSGTGRVQTLTVSGIFDLGNKAANARNTFVALRTAQTLFDLVGGASVLDVTVRDVYTAETIAQKMHQLTGLQADSWIKTNEQFFTAVKAQTTANTAIRFFVALSVGFGIASVLVVSVVQRSREIGILRAMGVTRGQVLRVFLIQGGLLGLGGAVLGSGIGALALFLWQRFMRNADGSEMFPLVFDSGLLLQTLLLATLTGLLSAFAPALRAARLDPVVAIRG